MAKKEHTITLLLTALAILLSTAARADDVKIPTTDENPFDLTKGTVTSNSTHEHFTEHGVEYMYDNDQLAYHLQNEEDLDVCNVYVGADTGLSGDIVSLSLSLKSQGGDVVADTTFQIESKGWYQAVTYHLQLHQLKRGGYTLTFTFHQSYNNNWSSCNISSIAFKKPQSLKPGDEVAIQNPEFDDKYDGWEYSGHLWYTTQGYGNNESLAHFNGGSGILSQTVYNLPDGTYLMQASAYDSWPGEAAPDTYVFLNEQMLPMMTAYDNGISYRNIYRLYEGKENSNYRHTPDNRWAPTHQVDWNEQLAMAKSLFVNSVAAVVTSGQATFGWKKAESRSTRINSDHYRLVYLSERTDLSADELATLAREQTTATYRAQLTGMELAVRTELAAKRPHAPQAVAEANNTINADLAYTTDAELVDAILHLEHLLQRLQLPFHDITLSSPGTLAEQLEAKGIQTTDTIALKLNGTLDDTDLATLKTLNKLMELDLGATTLTALPNELCANWKLLTWVTLPKQLETIGNSTFYNCPELRDMTLPATLRSIGTYAFRYTYNFCRADIPEGVTVANGAYNSSGIRHAVLPTTMTDVPYALFCNCYDLYDVQFNKQLNIGGNAFENCTALKTIHIPEGMERLQDQCFRYCTGLTSVTLPSTILSTARPFFNCRNLTELTCLAACPPYPNNQSLHGDITSTGFTLYVPRQAVEEYQEANKWGEFNVVGIDALPETFNVLGDLTLDMNDPYPDDYHPDVNLNALYYYWGNNVSSVGTYGHLTVDGPSTFSARRLTTVWSPFALRSMANRNQWGTTHTSLINNGHLRADDVTVLLTLYENCWEFLSFPFDVRVGDIRYQFPNVPLAIYGYDASKRADGKHSEAWVRMTADSTLHAGQGYIWQTVIPYDQIEERQKGQESYNYQYNRFFVDALQTVGKPKFFLSDDVEVALQKHESEYAHDRSWNFIGNPYPCYFDLQKIGTTAPIIVWTFTNSSNGQYRAYSVLDDDLILFPGQAFFVQCPLDQDRLVFHKEGRQHDLALHYDVAEARAARAAAQTRRVYNLLLSGACGELDRTRFVINEAATPDYEPGRDASKFFSLDATAAHLYTVGDGERYAIDERPYGDGTVRLGLKTGTEGTYTISLGASPAGHQEGQVILTDHETGIKTDLGTGSYDFQAKRGTTDDRFTLSLGGAAITSVTPVGMRKQEAGRLFDLQGRRVSQPQRGIYVKDNKKVIIK